MKAKTLPEAVKSFFSSLYYVVFFLVLAVISLAAFYGINWAISWAGCWLLYSQYPPPNMVNSFDHIPDHAQLGMPYVFGWMIIMLLSLCLIYAIFLYKKCLSK
jgi:hypothetical protein